MNQKQSEDFDSAVRKLAEEAESAYQAHSWTLMEKLLNDKKNKKRLAFWYWPLGVLGLIALTWFGYSYLNSPKQDKIENQLQILPGSNINQDKSYLYALTITADRAFDLRDTPSPESNNNIALELTNIPGAGVYSQQIKTSQVSTDFVSGSKLRNLKKIKSNQDFQKKEMIEIIFQSGTQTILPFRLKVILQNQN